MNTRNGWAMEDDDAEGTEAVGELVTELRREVLKLREDLFTVRGQLARAVAIIDMTHPGHPFLNEVDT